MTSATLTKRERQFLEGKLNLRKGSAYERRLRSDLKKKLGFSFGVVCVYCERAVEAGPMWQIAAGNNSVYACTDCAKKITTRKVQVTQQGIKPF